MRSEAEKKKFWRDLKIEEAEFVASHRLESKGRRTKFVQGRMLTVTGITLNDLVKYRMAEADGLGGYRPSLK